MLLELPIQSQTGSIKSIDDISTRPEDITTSIDNVIFIANTGSSSVSVIDTVTYKILTSIPVQFEPIAIAADTDPAGRIVFTANQESSSISIINKDTATLGRNIFLMHGPVGITVNPLITRVYTANL